MADHPPGSFPLVFESGVVAFDPDGTLRVFLTHGPAAPHPVQTHPDGADGLVPPTAREARVVGAHADGVVHGGFLDTDTLPEGLVIEISGYSMVKLEASGDLSVLVEGCAEPPAWFTPGKVHRFDGPDGPVRLWSGSAPVPKRRARAAEAPQPKPSPGPQATSSGPKPAGCGLVLALALVGGGAVALLA